jgi:G3E family GTPase
MRLKSINQNADIIRANLNRSSIDIDRILGLNAFSVEAVLKFDPEFLVDKEHQHDASVTSVGLKFEGDLMMFKFNMLISEMLETVQEKKIAFLFLSCVDICCLFMIYSWVRSYSVTKECCRLLA